MGVSQHYGEMSQPKVNIFILIQRESFTNDYIDKSVSGHQPYVPPEFDNTGSSNDFINSNYSAPVTGNIATNVTTSPKDNSNASIFSVIYYRSFFDLDTDDFIKRSIEALNVTSKETFGDVVNQRPDLYGPIWITSTVVFILFFATTLIGMFQQSGSEKYNYDFKLLSSSAGLLFSYTLITPIVLYLLTNFYFKISSAPSAVFFISLYGYSNTVLIFVSIILSILPLFFLGNKHNLILNILTWIIIFIGNAISGTFIFKNLYKDLELGCQDLPNGKKVILGLVIIGAIAHVGFAIAVKVIFWGFK